MVVNYIALVLVVECVVQVILFNVTTVPTYLICMITTDVFIQNGTLFCFGHISISFA